MSYFPLPRVDATLVPPSVLGCAALTEAALRGADAAALAAMTSAHGAMVFDRAIAAQLMFQRAEGLALLEAALAQTRLMRVHEPVAGAPRLLAICRPGDLMANAPVDCLTGPAGLGLDLLYFDPALGWPEAVPAHDVAFMAAAEPMPEGMLDALTAAWIGWPRPVLNDPAALPGLRREVLWRRLAGAPGLFVPPAARVSRAALLAGLPAGIDFPVLVRPDFSHAGHGLTLIADRAALVAALALADEAAWFHVSAFVDYRSADGMFRKYRVALIDGAPFLCHLAISEHWMVHYLNAGMTEHAARRAEEAASFAGFAFGFARRHAAALRFIHTQLGLDWVVLDCAELPDGRLMVFEADAAAIVHGMDAVGDFAYKREPMRRVAAEFAAMAGRKARRFAALRDFVPA